MSLVGDGPQPLETLTATDGFDSSIIFSCDCSFSGCLFTIFLLSFPGFCFLTSTLTGCRWNVEEKQRINFEEKTIYYSDFNNFAFSISLNSNAKSQMAEILKERQRNN